MLWHTFDIKSDIIFKLFIIRGAHLVKLLVLWCNIVVYSWSISSIQFHSIWPTGVELCACTSDCKCFTHMSEASMGHKRKPGPIFVLVSMRTQPNGRMLDLQSQGCWFNSQSICYQMVNTWMGDCLQTGKPSWYIKQPTPLKVNSSWLITRTTQNRILISHIIK